MQYIRRSVTVHDLRQHSSTTPRTGRDFRLFCEEWVLWPAELCSGLCITDEMTSRGLGTPTASPTGIVSPVARFVWEVSSELARDRVPVVFEHGNEFIIVHWSFHSSFSTSLSKCSTYRFVHCSTFHRKAAAKRLSRLSHSTSAACH